MALSPKLRLLWRVLPRGNPIWKPLVLALSVFVGIHLIYFNPVGKEFAEARAAGSQSGTDDEQWGSDHAVRITAVGNTTPILALVNEDATNSATGGGSEDFRTSYEDVDKRTLDAVSSSSSPAASDGGVPNANNAIESDAHYAIGNLPAEEGEWKMQEEEEEEEEDGERVDQDANDGREEPHVSTIADDQRKNAESMASELHPADEYITARHALSAPGEDTPPTIPSDAADAAQHIEKLKDYLQSVYSRLKYDAFNLKLRTTNVTTINDSTVPAPPPGNGGSDGSAILDLRGTAEPSLSNNSTHGKENIGEAEITSGLSSQASAIHVIPEEEWRMASETFESSGSGHDPATPTPPLFQEDASPEGDPAGDMMGYVDETDGRRSAAAGDRISQQSDGGMNATTSAMALMAVNQTAPSLDRSRADDSVIPSIADVMRKAVGMASGPKTPQLLNQKAVKADVQDTSITRMEDGGALTGSLTPLSPRDAYGSRGTDSGAAKWAEGEHTQSDLVEGYRDSLMSIDTGKQVISQGEISPGAISELGISPGKLHPEAISHVKISQYDISQKDEPGYETSKEDIAGDKLPYKRPQEEITQWDVSEQKITQEETYAQQAIGHSYVIPSPTAGEENQRRQEIANKHSTPEERIQVEGEFYDYYRNDGPFDYYDPPQHEDSDEESASEASISEEMIDTKVFVSNILMFSKSAKTNNASISLQDADVTSRGLPGNALVVTRSNDTSHPISSNAAGGHVSSAIDISIPIDGNKSIPDINKTTANDESIKAPSTSNLPADPVVASPVLVVNGDPSRLTLEDRSRVLKLLQRSSVNITNSRPSEVDLKVTSHPDDVASNHSSPSGGLGQWQDQDVPSEYRASKIDGAAVSELQVEELNVNYVSVDSAEVANEEGLTADIVITNRKFASSTGMEDQGISEEFDTNTSSNTTSTTATPTVATSTNTTTEATTTTTITTVATTTSTTVATTTTTTTPTSLTTMASEGAAGGAQTFSWIKDAPGGKSGRDPAPVGAVDRLSASATSQKSRDAYHYVGDTSWRKEVTCADLMAGSADASKKVSSYLAGRGDREIPDSGDLLAEAANCERFKLLYNYGEKPASAEEAAYPVAFTLMIYTDAVQFEMLLRAIYQPQNIYCVHVDGKADSLFKDAIAWVASCFDNVFVTPDVVDVIYGGFSRLEADFSCMRKLLKSKVPWKYLINLTGHEFPLKTNYEMVQILKSLRGYTDLDVNMPSLKLQEWRFQNRWEIVEGHEGWELSERVNDTKKSPPGGVRIVKGGAYGIFGRNFLSYVLSMPPEVKAFLDWSRDIWSPDEVFWASIYMRRYNPMFKSPGGLLGKQDLNTYKDFLAKFVIWKGQKTLKCHGHFVRLVCIFNSAALPKLIAQPQLFANKFDIHSDHVALNCLGEWLDKRTREKPSFDVSYYDKYWKTYFDTN